MFNFMKRRMDITEQISFFAAGALVGAGLMFIFDMDRGSARREVVYNKVGDLSRRIKDRVSQTSHRLTDRFTSRRAESRPTESTSYDTGANSQDASAERDMTMGAPQNVSSTPHTSASSETSLH